MMKRALSVGLALLLAFIGWTLFSRLTGRDSDAVQQRGSSAAAVEITPIARVDLPDVANLSGSLYPYSEFVVAPKVAGRLEKILVDIGDKVGPDQLIAVLDSEEYSRQVDQAAAELEVSEATLMERRTTLANARLEYQRTLALFDKKIASQSQLDSAKADYDAKQAQMRVAEAVVAQRKAALETARVRLSYTRIQIGNGARGHRVVGERFVDQGAMLAANTPIATVIEIGTLKAVVSVIERDYPKIKPGLRATLRTDAFPVQAFQGRVLRVAPLIKEASREARVEIEIPNDDLRLKPGMFVRVEIEFDRRSGATVVPLQALVKRNGDTGVFLADADQKSARFVAVQTGIVTPSQAEVVAPPLEGSVVTLGQHLLEDGSPIRVTGRSADKGAGKP